ncbi:hypothetical protein JHU04_002591 [Brenneria sp. 4F2]|nr:hypothetical protein [Brenneria bubanii]
MRSVNQYFSIFLLAIMMAFFIFFYINRPQSTKLSCDASFVVHKNGYVIKLLMSYIFYDKTGIAMLNGTLSMPDGIINTVNRRTVFNYKKVNNGYFLISTDSYSMSHQAANVIFSEVLPVFYFKKDINFNIIIYPQGNEGWVFATDPVPSFLCENR